MKFCNSTSCNDGVRSERSKRIANPSKQHNPPKCLRGCQRVASIRYAVHGQGIKNEIGINGKSMSKNDKVRKRQSGLRILATRGMQNCRCCWSLVVAKCSAVRGYASAMESKATSCRSFARKRVLGIYLVAGLPLVARSLWPIWHQQVLGKALLISTPTKYSTRLGQEDGLQAANSCRKAALSNLRSLGPHLPFEGC